MSETAAKSKRKKNGFIQWRENPTTKEQVPYIPCQDGRNHRYLNADVKELDATPPKPKQRSCPRCGMAYAELRTDDPVEARAVPMVRCWECGWEDSMEGAESLSLESGQQFTSSMPRHVSLRL